MVRIRFLGARVKRFFLKNVEKIQASYDSLASITGAALCAGEARSDGVLVIVFQTEMNADFKPSWGPLTSLNPTKTAPWELQMLWCDSLAAGIGLVECRSGSVLSTLDCADGD